MNTDYFDKDIQYKHATGCEYERIDVGNATILLFERIVDEGGVRKAYSIKDVLKKWGVGNHYQEMLSDLQNMCKWYKVVDNNVYIYVYASWGRLQPEPREQKVVDFTILHKADGDVIHGGGYSFLLGTMSKHT